MNRRKHRERTYCFHLWRKNQSWNLFAVPGTGANWSLGVLMGLLWMGSLAVYGAASTRLAAMGPVLAGRCSCQ
jgi:hypothetical protein